MRKHNKWGFQVFFRAGVLGQLEEIREERLSKVVTWMQSAIRGYISKIDFKKYRDQRYTFFNLLFTIT